MQKYGFSAENKSFLSLFLYTYQILFNFAEEPVVGG